MKRAVVEGRTGGRCYTEQEDGTDCDWGTGVHFVPQPDGSTRVDLEHRHLSRHGAGAGAMRMSIDSPNGWSGMLRLFGRHADGAAHEATDSAR